MVRRAVEKWVCFVFVNEAMLDPTKGLEQALGSSFISVNKDGLGKSRSTLYMQKDSCTFIFSQKGLMVGIGIQGNKFTKLAN